MEIPRHWRLKKQRYGLVGEVCPHCDYKIFPPKEKCPNCGGGLSQVALGEVVNASTVEEAAIPVLLVTNVPVVE